MQPSTSDEREILAYTGESRPAGAAPVGRARAYATRLARFLVNGALTVAALVGLLGPAVVFLVALSWSAVTYARSLSLLVGFVQARNFGALGPQLRLLNIAARLTLLSAGYFALVFSLIVVYAGVLGRRRQRTLLIPGLLLLVPSTIAYMLGALLTAETTSALTGAPLQALAAGFLYVLFDAFALGVLLADVRAPVRRARRFMRRRRYFLWQRMPYYSRRLHSRYAVFREALRPEESAGGPVVEPVANSVTDRLPPTPADRLDIGTPTPAPSEDVPADLTTVA